MDRKYISGEEVIYFWSNAKEPYNKFSNFHQVDNYIFEGIQYPSVEHAYVAQFYNDKLQFSINGKYKDFANVSVSENYWMKKNNIGIVAKMANKQLRGKQLKPPISYKRWIELQLEKYNKEPFKSLLLSTENIYLCEYGRKNKIKPEHWTGLIFDNKLYGENFGGKVLMEVRDILRNTKN